MSQEAVKTIADAVRPKGFSDAERLGDGLPDTGVLIRRMSQRERDRILDHPAINSKKRI